MSNNTKLPAYPCTNYYNGTSGEIMADDCPGFTKIELASLMIGAQIAHKWGGAHAKHVAEESVDFAKAILEEANK